MQNSHFRYVCVCACACFSYLHLCLYGRINSIKSHPTGKCNDSEPQLMSQVVRVRESPVCIDQRAFVFGAAEVPVFVCLRSYFYHVTEGGGPTGL